MKNWLYILILFLSHIAFSQPTYHRIWSVKEEGKVDTNAWRNRFIFNDTIYAKDNVGVNNAIKYISMPEGETGIFAQLGSSDNTEILDMHFDGENYIYISGYTTQSENFATPGTYRTAYENNEFAGGDGFIACFSLSGELQWCSYTEPFFDGNNSISTDNEGNVYLAGGLKSNEDIIENSPFQSTATPYDEFPLSGMAQTITKLNNQGQYVWSTFFGIYNTIILDIDCTNDGVVIMGQVNNGINNPPTDNPTYFSTTGAYEEQPELNNEGGFNINYFVNKFNFDGTRVWGTYYHTDESGYFLDEVKTYGNDIYLISIYNSSGVAPANIATEGAFIDNPENQNIRQLLTKMTPDGSGLQWRTYTSNNIFSKVFNDISINSDGNIWLFGQTDSFEGVATEDAYQTEKDPTPSYLLSHSDAYHLLLSNDGSTVLYATYFGFDGKDLTKVIFPAENGYYSVEQTSGNSDAENFITQGNLLEPDEEGSSTYGGLVYTYFSTEPVSSGTFDKKKISIYPNPAENVLHLTGEIESFTKIDIYNMQGQRVLQQPINASEIISVDIASIASGVYLLTISNATNKQTYRVVKK